MTAGVHIAHVAALVGDPGRANMLALLMDGRAHTASELADAAGVSRPTASGHLFRLETGGLVSVAPQGRHRYFRLASPAVAAMLEGLMVIAGASPCAPRATPRIGPGLREARTCYDHMAGRLGVAVADALVRRGAVLVDGESASLTASGSALMEELGIPIAANGKSHRSPCRPCLDWSERRPHLAGALGAALLNHALDRRWVTRVSGCRELVVTARGADAFAAAFGPGVAKPHLAVEDGAERLGGSSAMEARRVAPRPSH